MAPNPTAVCPPAESLRGFIRGALTLHESEGIGLHLAECRSCLRSLDDLASEDPFLNAVQHAAHQPVELSPEWEKLIAGLENLPIHNTDSWGAWNSTITGRRARTVDLSGLLSPAKEPGDVGCLDHFRVLGILGQGGMGIVLAAHDPRLNRQVALKIMLPQNPPRPDLVQRFEREAQSLAAIHSDHVVEVHAVGTAQTPTGAVPYLSMPLLRGETLADRLLCGALPLPQFLDLASQIAFGLAAIHKQDLVHRDIKPGNLWLERLRADGPEVCNPEERVKFLDFGLARLERNPLGLTQTGEAMGTPAYMSPEQAAGKGVDQRSDLFSMGVVFYEMATGRQAFTGCHKAAVIVAVVNEQPIEPAGLNPTLPRRLCKLISSLISKHPDRRPASAFDVYRELQSIKRELSTPPSTSRHRSWFTPVRGILALVLLCGFLGWGYAQIIRIQTPHGILIIDAIDPNVVVRITRGKTTIVDRTTDRRFELDVGEYGIQLVDAPNGIGLSADHVTITRERTPIVKITREPLAANSGTKVSSSPAEPSTVRQTAEPEKNVSHDQKAAAPSVEVAVERAVPRTSLTPVLDGLRRERISVPALSAAGQGDADRAPSSLVAVLGEPVPIHRQRIEGVAFSHDSRRIATASHDRTVIVRDAADGKVVRVLEGHEGPVSSVAFSPDDRTVISASHDGTIKLWPVEQEAAPETLDPQLGEIAAMAASSDGRYIAAGGSTKTVKLWKWGDWKLPTEIPALPGKVTALALAPNGDALAVAWESAQPDTVIRIYNTADGQPVMTLPVRDKRINTLAFSRDGKHLVLAGALNTQVWNIASEESEPEFALEHGLISANFGLDEKSLIFTDAYDQRVMLYDIPSREQKVILALTPGPMGGIFSPDGKHLAVHFANGALYVAETGTWKQEYVTTGHRHFVDRVVFSPDCNSILSSGDDFTLRRWDLSQPGTNQILRQFDGDVGLLTCAPDGQTLIATAMPPYCYWGNVLDAANGQELFPVIPPHMRDLAPIPGGKRLSSHSKLTFEFRLSQVAYSSDGNRLALAFGNMFGPSHVQFSTGDDPTRDVHQLPGIGIWNGLSFDEEGKQLAAVDLQNNCVKLWDLANDTEIRSWNAEFNPHREFMLPAAFSPDLGLLAVGHEDGTIQLWDAAQSKKQNALVGHKARTHQLKFTRNGKTLVSSSRDGTIRLWSFDPDRPSQVVAVGPANAPLNFDLDASDSYLVAAGSSPLIYILRILQDEQTVAKQQSTKSED